MDQSSKVLYKASINGDACKTQNRASTLQITGNAVGHSRSMSAPSSNTASDNWNISPHSFYQLTKGWNRVFSCKRGEDELHCRRTALEKDVAELQSRLEDERAVRNALEHVTEPLSNALSPLHPSIKPEAQQLLTEIANLEGEVAHLEQHVLFLYRKVFDEHVKGMSKLHDGQNLEKNASQQEQPQTWGLLRNAFRLRKSPSPQHRHHLSAAPWQECLSDELDLLKNQEIQQSLTQNTSKRAGGVCQHSAVPSLSRSMTMDMQSSDTQTRSSPDSFYPSIGYSFETPNRLSEELVRCMAAIYFKLSDPPFPQIGVTKSQSSTNFNFSREPPGDNWSPQWRTASYTSHLADPFEVEVSSGNIGAYSSMVEVCRIYVDRCRLEFASRALRKFRFMIEQLEKVDPGQLKHEEKMAFWINVYNALMMHTFLAYGIPQNHLERVTLLKKVAYRIGTSTINASTIEQILLGCRHHRPAKWLQTFLSPLTRGKGAEDRHAFALDSFEPLACFSLSSGGHSDPAVRVYSAKNIRMELESAMRDFLQASIGISKDNKVIHLPRILEWYTREKCVSTKSLLGWVCQNVPEKQHMISKCIAANVHKSSAQCIEWLPYDYRFRYILVPDLAYGFRQSTH